MEDGSLPKALAVAPVEARQDALLLFIAASDEEDAILPDDWRGMAAARHWRFPGQIQARLAIPLRRNTSFEARAIAARTSPRRPVFGWGSAGSEPHGEDT